MATLFFRCTAESEMYYPLASGVVMQKRAANRLLVPASRRWSRARERSICPRRHLRVLPALTRPSLFAGD